MASWRVCSFGEERFFSSSLRTSFGQWMLTPASLKAAALRVKNGSHPEDMKEHVSTKILQPSSR